jgi:hypothetical protein
MHRRVSSPRKLVAPQSHNFRDLMLKYLVRTSRDSLHYIWECYFFSLLSRLCEPLPQRPGPWQMWPPLAQLTVQTRNKAALEAWPFKRLYEAHWGPPIILQQVISHEEIHFFAAQNRGRLKQKAGGLEERSKAPRCSVWPESCLLVPIPSTKTMC